MAPHSHNQHSLHSRCCCCCDHFTDRELTGAHRSTTTRRAPTPPAITTRSDADAMRIATKLAGKHSTMYGAYWCSHCYDQKQRVGKKAFGTLRFIECDKHGANTQNQLCPQKRVPGYPTWEMNGELQVLSPSVPSFLSFLGGHFRNYFYFIQKATRT